MPRITIMCKQCNKPYMYEVKSISNRLKSFCFDCALKRIKAAPRDYSKYYKPKGRINFGLSLNSFPNKKEYYKAVREREKMYEENRLIEFIKDQVNGGFAFDSESVLI